ncbi:MAG: ATP-binding cassette domain-containing protein [Proteobacteria bacterium]|nr:MAG: ATP-binding cassette domain-containing protein [Pseudomonadota bacterium]
MDQVSPSDTLQAEGIRCHGIGPLSLSVRAGECLCISGASGSGKSLLLRSIADMEPHEGSVTWRGTAAEKLSGPQWRRRIGLLPAESEWWGSRVSDHFADASAAQQLPEVGLPTAMWQARIRDLSTGERQRLALIRLLANQPQVLLLDEPTASLDPESTRRIESLIRRYQQEHGSPIIWVSHDPEQITRVASRHLRLDRVLSEMKRS